MQACGRVVQTIDELLLRNIESRSAPNTPETPNTPVPSSPDAFLTQNPDLDNVASPTNGEPNVGTQNTKVLLRNRMLEMTSEELAEWLIDVGEFIVCLSEMFLTPSTTITIWFMYPCV